MPVFEYSAVDAESEETTGKIEATTQVDAINKLKSQGLWPKQVIEEGKRKLRASKNDRKKNRIRSKSQNKSKGSYILSSVLVGGGALGIVLYFLINSQKKSKIIEAIKINDPPVMSELLSPVADAKPELEGVNDDELEYRGDILYLKDSDTPYTGKAINFWENGQKSGEINVKNGREDGLWVGWHKNGQKSSEGNFKNGKEDGPSTEWHENGQKMSEEIYKDGKLVEGSAKYWNSKGEPVDSLEETGWQNKP